MKKFLTTPLSGKWFNLIRAGHAKSETEWDALNVMLNGKKERRNLRLADVEIDLNIQKE